MLFDISNFGHYKKIIINDDDGNPAIHLGLHDAGDREELAIALLTAVYDLVYKDFHDQDSYEHFVKKYTQ